MALLFILLNLRLLLSIRRVERPGFINISITYINYCVNSDIGKSTRKKSTLFFHFFLTTLSLSGLNRFFLSFIEPELATAIISFLKPGVAGGKTLSIVSEIGNLV